jgi:hypothetical protein
VPSLASGAKATFTLTVRAASPGKVTVTAKSMEKGAVMDDLRYLDHPTGHPGQPKIFGVRLERNAKGRHPRSL